MGAAANAAFIAGMAVAGSAAWAQLKEPAPDFVVAAEFENSLARHLAEICPQLGRDHAGFSRHMKALFADFSDRQIATDAASLSARFDLPSQDQLLPLMNAFEAKHGLGKTSDTEALCAAGQAEATERTKIGQLIKLDSE